LIFAIVHDREDHEPAINGRTFQETDAAALLLQHRNAADGLGAGAPQVYIDAIAGGGVPPARFLRGGVRNCRWL